jgi:hypothetical protein
MVQSANGHREPVANFARHGTLLCKLDVVVIRRGPFHKPDMAERRQISDGRGRARAPVCRWQ